MTEIRHIFFDIGGVLATNGWDREQRKAAVERFGLDAADFQARHEEMVGPLEQGEVTLDEYLDFTILCTRARVNLPELKEFIFAQSRPNQESIEIAREVAAGCSYWVMTLNNESDELNRYRISTFGLDEIFDAYLSSCWLGLRKPTHKFYDRALSIAQAKPEQSLFIDDRQQNLTPAAALGMKTILYQSPDQLRSALVEHGIQLNPTGK
jgi:putative hydrolase of the HAD superfamily